MTEAEIIARVLAGERNLFHDLIRPHERMVYLMAFLTLVWQGPALLGPRGLLPIDSYLAEAMAEAGSRAAGFWQLPSLFWLGASDGALRAAGIVGVVLSAAVLAGVGTLIWQDRDVRVADGAVGPVTQALRAALVDVQRGVTPDRFGWLTAV